MQFKTCLTTVYNHRLTHLTFCLTDWVSARSSCSSRTATQNNVVDMILLWSQSEIVTSISSSCPTDTDGGSNGGVCGAKDLEYDVR